MLQVITTNFQKINEDSTNVLLLFQDDTVNREQYNYLKDILDNFKSSLSAEYLLNSQVRYDRCSGHLVIELIITISNHLMPKDLERDIFNQDIIKKFTKFYESQLEHFMKNQH
jgi:hypothetical protein